MGSGFVAHLSKRHAVEFTAAVPHQLDESQMPGPGSLEDTMADMMADNASAEAAAQLHLLLKHKREDTLPEIERRLPSTAATNDAARVRLMCVEKKTRTPRSSSAVC